MYERDDQGRQIDVHELEKLFALLDFVIVKRENLTVEFFFKE
jgi:hypothetical protein